jgi:hypothetical protein
LYGFAASEEVDKRQRFESKKPEQATVRASYLLATRNA